MQGNAMQTLKKEGNAGICGQCAWNRGPYVK